MRFAQHHDVLLVAAEIACRFFRMAWRFSQDICVRPSVLAITGQVDPRLTAFPEA
jgi:hypothetical protein